MKIGNFEINKNSKTFLVAELSANHGGNIEIAKKTIKAMKDSGADAVKLQTYRPDTITLDCNNKYFTINQGTIWDGQKFYDLYKKAYTPWEWHEELFNYAKNIDLICFSTPFDKTAIDLLEELNTPAYKIASFEIMDIPLIKYAAKKGKPMIISIGLATLYDIEEAINACKEVGNNNIILLQCTSQYPAPIENANIIKIKHLKETFGVESGLSDHTIGITCPIISIAFGAKLIEKHFILDKNIGGPDSSFSIEPKDFKLLVESIRNAEKSIGEIDYSIDENKKNSRELGRSLFVSKDIKAGEKFTENNIKSVRPANGLHPKYYDRIIGNISNEDIKRGTPLKFKYIKDI